MGLLDQVVGALSGGQAGGNNALLETVMQLVSNPQTGGLGGLVQSLEKAGLGNVASSWVGNGANLPISADQISSVLGGSTVAGLAEKLGMSHEQVSGGLAQMLPQIVDHLTPNGQVPQGGGDLLAQGMELLKGKLFS